MADDILSMNEEDLLQESGEIKKWARDFDRDLEEAASRISNMTWEGGSGDSFRGVFKTANDQFDLVRTQIDDIGLLLARVAAGISKADRELAARLID